MNASDDAIKKKLALAEGLFGVGKMKEAEEMFRTVQEMVIADNRPEKSQIPALDGLGRALFAQKRMAESETAFKKILDILTEAFGETHSNVALALQNLARVRSERGAASSAIELGNKALDILAKNLGPEHPRVAQAYFSLSGYKYAAKDFDGAAQDIEAAMAVWEKLNGPESTEVAICLNNLARTYEERDKPTKGAELHRKAVDIRKKLLGDHPDTAFSLANLGSSLAESGRLNDAIDALRASLACYERIGRADSIEAKTCRQNLIRCQEAADRENMPS